MLQHPIQIVHYVAVSHSDNPEPFAGKPGSSALIICELLRVTITVHFDDQPGVRTEEIGDEGPKPYLPAEFGAVQLARSEAGPQLALGGGGIATSLANAA